ncbi:MAG TPA: amino acid ABC transporter permease [Aestuariivirga sp.]
MTNSNTNNGASDSGAPILHQRAGLVASLAVAFAIICIAVALGTAFVVSGALDYLNFDFRLFWPIAGVLILVVASLLKPALAGFSGAMKARAALASGDIVQARIDTASAREHAQITFGYGTFVLIVLAFICFVLMNHAAVGDTFFRLPLIHAKWWLITFKFISVNLFIFVVAEILVLVWGLIVALARLTPGRAGKPIRALAIFYCDLFRGLPAIVTLYLIGFGIPTSGISDRIMEPIMSLFVNLSALEPTERAAALRVDVVWWCIIALTLTYGAYVAEVYRAGIESIHHSQFMASRSLGLSYMQTMRYVIVPQAVRRIVAPLLNDFIGLQKDTALVQVLGVTDAFNQSKIIAANAFNLSAVTVVAVLFVLVTIPQARLVDKLIDRDNARMKAGG